MDRPSSSSLYRLVRPEYEQVVVSVESPSPDLPDGEIVLRIRYLDRGEREQVITSLREQAEAGTRRSDLEVAADLILDWDGIADGDGGPLAYCPEALVLAYSHPHVARAISTGIRDYLWALPIARKKSSPTSAGSGPRADGE